MGVKRYNDGSHAKAARLSNSTANDLLMPAMNTVKDADGRNRSPEFMRKGSRDEYAFH
jgi:hypothetical protein